LPRQKKGRALVSISAVTRGSIIPGISPLVFYLRRALKF
jgi:hypothetical protein